MNRNELAKCGNMDDIFDVPAPSAISSNIRTGRAQSKAAYSICCGVNGRISQFEHCCSFDMSYPKTNLVNRCKEPNECRDEIGCNRLASVDNSTTLFTFRNAGMCGKLAARRRKSNAT
eukprot:9557805-Ditylum_brightwellii.AAC.1